MPTVREPPQWSLPTTISASGCFETMRVYHGRIFRLEAHLDRLAASAHHLGVQMSLTRARLARRLVDTLDRSGLQEAILRVALIPGGSDAAGLRRVSPHRPARPSIVVQPVVLPTPSQYRQGIQVAIVPTRKFPVSQIDPQAKFSARLGSILAVQDAQLRQADEAVFLDTLTGSATESTASNLGVIADGLFLAPPCWMGLLAGITWQALLEVAAALRIPHQERPLSRHELYNAEEAFVLSTIKEILPVTRIDGRCIGAGKPGPVTKRLHQGFRELVKRELR